METVQQQTAKAKYIFECKCGEKVERVNNNPRVTCFNCKTKRINKYNKCLIDRNCGYGIIILKGSL